MVDKKNLLCDSLLYLALVASISRLETGRPDAADAGHGGLLFESVGRSSVDHYGPTSAVHVYLHRFPRDIRSDLVHYPSAKSNVVLEETLRLYREVHQLGRYTRRYNTNVFAYLVSGGAGDHQRPRPEAASTPSVASGPALVEPPDNETPSSSPTRPSLSPVDHLAECIEPREEEDSEIRRRQTTFERKERRPVIATDSRQDSILDFDFDEALFEDVPVGSDAEDSCDGVCRAQSDLDVDSGTESWAGDSGWPRTPNSAAAAFVDSDAEAENSSDGSGDLANDSLRVSSNDPLLSASLFGMDEFGATPATDLDDDDDVNNLWTLGGEMMEEYDETAWTSVFTSYGHVAEDPSAVVSYDSGNYYSSNGQAYSSGPASIGQATGGVLAYGHSQTTTNASAPDFSYVYHEEVPMVPAPGSYYASGGVCNDSGPSYQTGPSYDSAPAYDSGNETYSSYYSVDSANFSTGYATAAPVVEPATLAYQQQQIFENHTYSDPHGPEPTTHVLQFRESTSPCSAPASLTASSVSSVASVKSNSKESRTKQQQRQQVIVHSHPHHQHHQQQQHQRFDEESRDGSYGDSMYDDCDDEESQASRDEKRARALNIPIPTPDIINLPIDEFNERLAKFDLNEAQLSLIRDIRRRGKNKVAAQNCRKRKMDQIVGLQGEVDMMYSQKEMLLAQQSELFRLRELAHDRYNSLYAFVTEKSKLMTGAQNTTSFKSELN